MNKKTYTAPAAEYIKLALENRVCITATSKSASETEEVLSTRRSGEKGDIRGDGAKSGSGLWGEGAGE